MMEVWLWAVKLTPFVLAGWVLWDVLRVDKGVY